ncbi:MAG: YdcF family protein [Planctomycetota bacterium]
MIFRKKTNRKDEYDEDYSSLRQQKEPFKGSIMWLQLSGFFLSLVIAMVFTGLFGGQALFENSLIALATPVGVIWLFLLFSSYFCLLQRLPYPAALAILAWLVLAVFGNSFVSNQLLYSLEKPHVDFSPDELIQLDVLFLLGGGTSTNLHGQEQVDDSGDRVVTAARLFHAGKVDRIVCTGQQLFRTDDADMHPNEEAARLLKSLAIPESAIFQISGQNTSEEMKLAAEFLKEHDLINSRYGVLTSAWHLNRANRLATANSLRPVLIPADFKSRHFTSGPGLVIPTADSLASTSKSVKEYLAWLVGR